MLRTIFLKAARSATRTSAHKPATPLRFAPRSSVISLRQLAPALSCQTIRCYSAGGALTKDEITGRILDLLKNFDKVQDASKLSPSSHFTNDLGLDSLDTVEVVMAIEEEFSIEIPDKEADAIHSVDKAVDYIQNQPDAH
ncbi:acyl carrier protein [Viridothelium virens]|uniref:Acyl carrier protein n=1 Tax=Viridothelium virens TaxID=1048519 RepID=A0A6A6H658_VIRVR|nr:acyl carrier protein [Viridothelium virens]